MTATIAATAVDFQNLFRRLEGLKTKPSPNCVACDGPVDQQGLYLQAGVLGDYTPAVMCEECVSSYSGGNRADLVATLRRRGWQQVAPTPKPAAPAKELE